MRRKEIHFKRYNPIKRFFRKLRIKWSAYWTPDRKEDLQMAIACGAFIALMTFLFIMGD